jgi:hypothetical protein
MKSFLFTLVIILTVAAQKCKKDREPVIPTCIMNRIEQIKKEPRWNPPAEVREYKYEGKRVFYFTSDCCDQYNEVYNDSCQLLCAPDGGLTGKGDGKCADFFKAAEKVGLVWKDER